MRLAHRLRAVLALFALALLAGPAPAQQINWTVSFDDPGGVASSYYQTITANIQAAGARWGQYLQPAGTVTVATEVRITTDFPRAAASSTTTSYVNTVNGFNIFEQGAAALIRTGENPNDPGQPNIRIQLNPNYMQNEVWWDPNPTLRTDPVPNNRVDSMSVMLHELGHALAFNGWHNLFDGSFPGDYKSTYDRYVSFDGSNLYFNGPTAVGVYGKAIPLTYGNSMHLGNDPPRPGQDLIPDLMNGVVFYFGTRYDISPLDVAILTDSGLSVVPVPEPTWVVVVAAAGAALVRTVRRRRAA